MSTTTKPKRDPRVDPKPGDVIREDQCYMRVTHNGKQVHYTLTSVGGRGIYALPLGFKMTLRMWQKTRKNAGVIHCAD